MTQNRVQRATNLVLLLLPVCPKLESLRITVLREFKTGSILPLLIVLSMKTKVSFHAILQLSETHLKSHCNVTSINHPLEIPLV